MCPGDVQGVQDGVLDGVQDDPVLAFLESIQKYDELINAKMVEYDQIMTLATKITPNMDGMPHGSDVTDKVGNAVVKLVTLAEETNRLVDHYITCKEQVTKALEQLPAMEYGVLHRYYVQGMTWEEVAKDMGYSDMQVYRYRLKGLASLKDVIECYTIPTV